MKKPSKITASRATNIINAIPRIIQTSLAALIIRFTNVTPSLPLLFLNKEIIDSQRIYSGAEKAAHRFSGCADNRFPKKIERCVNKDGDTGLLPEFIEQAPVERTGFAADRMNAGHSVRKPGGGNQAPLVISDPRYAEQKPRKRAAFLEKLLRTLFRNRSGERPRCFPVLDEQVKVFLYMRQQRGGENAPCPERTRAEFGAPLKPSDDVSLIKQSRNLVEKLILRNNVPVSQLAIIQDGFDLLVGILRSQEDILQGFRAPLVKLVMPLK